MKGFSSILRGITGQYEPIRVLGALGVLVYILGANIFEGYIVFGTDKGFDLVAYCAAFPGGLGVAIAAVAGSAAYKDKATATAQVIRDTQALPAQPVTPAAPSP